MKKIFLMKKRTNIKNSKFFEKKNSRLSKEIKTLNNNNDKNEKKFQIQINNLNNKIEKKMKK